MANHKSALKRARQNEIRRLRNKAYKTRAKNVIKQVRIAADGNQVEEARAHLGTAVSTMQKAASKGVIHPNTAARKISRLYRRVNRASAA